MGSYLVKELLGGLVVMLLVCGVAYFIGGLAYYRMFKLCGHDRPWAAWVPIYNIIVMCECCASDEVDLIGPIKIPMNIFKFWWVALVVACFIPFLNILLVLAIYVLSMGWIFQHMLASARGTLPEEELINGYLCATNPLLALIIMFKVEPIPME